MADGTYRLESLGCALEVLKIFGRDAIQEVFKTSQVLGIRNIFGEGTTLTHEEWNILVPELSHMSEDFASLLLESPNIKKRPSWFYQEFERLVLRVFNSHPYRGDSRLCNKLLSLVVPGHSIPGAIIAAESLYSRIVDETLEVYYKITEKVDFDEVVKQIDQMVAKMPKGDPNQLQVSRLPKWYNPRKALVDRGTLLRLLFKTSDLQDWTQNNRIFSPRPRDEEENDSHAQVVRHIQREFAAEYIHSFTFIFFYLSESLTTTLNPTYNDLLIKGYIKVAHVLRPEFVRKLQKAFGERIKVAPVKLFARCQPKALEASIKGPPPYAPYLVDFLRGTVLCSSVEEMVTTLATLCDVFEVVRIKRRILPTDEGNKVILTNLIVSDPSIEPQQYEWSGWWKKGEVKMIAEVFNLFYMLKIIIVAICFI